MSKVTDNTLLFFSKNDIPFEKAKLLIHNPTINELSLKYIKRLREKNNEN